MKKRIISHLTFILIAVLSFSAAFSQNLEEVKSQFPGEQVVIWNHSVHYKIKVKDGQPTAESKDVQELMYLSANAASYMSHYSFYHSSFHQLQDYEAYTIAPGGKKLSVKDFK